VGDTSKRGLELTHGGAEGGVQCFARILWQITESGLAAGQVRGSSPLVPKLSTA
jgi:hypothetical protein